MFVLRVHIRVGVRVRITVRVGLETEVGLGLGLALQFRLGLGCPMDDRARILTKDGIFVTHSVGRCTSNSPIISLKLS